MHTPPTRRNAIQELELGPDDRPAIMSSPVTELRGDFPLRPALLGRLVPQNMNLWMGRRCDGARGCFVCDVIHILHAQSHQRTSNPPPTNQPTSAAGSTSGLHHDYHDNLYVLLRGLKTFRLYSPADAPRCVAGAGDTRTHVHSFVHGSAVCIYSAPLQHQTL